MFRNTIVLLLVTIFAISSYAAPLAVPEGALIELLQRDTTTLLESKIG
jgi:hypothetical protein